MIPFPGHSPDDELDVDSPPNASGFPGEDTPDAPQLFVVPLDPEAEAINRVRLRSFAAVSWIGCLYPPREGGGSWLDRLLPF